MLLRATLTGAVPDWRMAHVPLHVPWEIEPLGDNFIGRDARCAVVVADGTPGRFHARIFRRGEQWFVEDARSAPGTFVDHRQIGDQRCPLRPGATLQIPVAARFDTFAGHLLDDVIATSSAWVLFGRRRPLCVGRFPAFRRRPDGGITRGIVVIGAAPAADIGVAPLEQWREGALWCAAYEDADGVPLDAFLATEPPAEAIAGTAARLAGSIDAAVDLVVTWDGDVRVLPLSKPSERASSVASVLASALRGPLRAQPLGRDALAAMVRGVFHDEWTEEQRVREELEMASLADDGVARLIERARRATPLHPRSL